MLRTGLVILGALLLLAACDKGPKAPSPPKPPIKATSANVSGQTPATGSDDTNPSVVEESTDDETDSDSEPQEAYEVDDTDSVCDSDGAGDGDDG